MSDRGYVWLAFGDAYIEASNKLASSIKSHNRHNQICVITNKQSIDKFKNIDKTVPFEGDSKGKFEKEWQVFKLSPFTHTIKLEADMIFTSSTDWWWNYLHQWDMVHSYDCRNYKDDIVKNKNTENFLIRITCQMFIQAYITFAKAFGPCSFILFVRT